MQQKLEQVSEQIIEAGLAVLEAQGSDDQLLEWAYQQLEQAEKELKIVQNMEGSKATENPQFQQAYEQLHNTRQQVQEGKQNSNDIL